MDKRLEPSIQYVRKMEEFNLAKENFRSKLINLTTELIDNENIKKTPEMVLAITEASKVCLEGFRPDINSRISL